MKKTFKVIATTAAIVGTALIVKKLLEGDVIQDKFKEMDAMDYLREKYGDDVMDGKKIQIVNEDSHADKTTLAKDLVDYKMHKED